MVKNFKLDNNGKCFCFFSKKLGKLGIKDRFYIDCRNIKTIVEITKAKQISQDNFVLRFSVSR